MKHFHGHLLPSTRASSTRCPLARSAPGPAVLCHTCGEAPRGPFSSPMLIVALWRATACLQLGCRDALLLHPRQGEEAAVGAGVVEGIEQLQSWEKG